MEFLEHISLSQFTTFRIGGPARVFCHARSPVELEQASQYAYRANLPTLILGGGSNMLVSDTGFPGLVIRIENQGIEETRRGESAFLRCAAGEPWDGIVAHAVAAGYWGIENLSHIPGNVGAFAVQNVGAYGQEASQVIDSLVVFDLKDKTVKNFHPDQCNFGYRTSIFNSSQKGRYVILEVALQLQLRGRGNLTYPDVARYFAERGITTPRLPEIRQAIIQIRDLKFTTPDKVPNAGSFFKNFILNTDGYESLEERVVKNFDSIVRDKLQGYRQRLATPIGIKIPAAFLIEACQLKGLQIGGVKVNETQPLVLLNITGAATARDVLSLVKAMRQAVYAKTGLELKPEPELIGFSQAEITDCFALP